MATAYVLYNPLACNGKGEEEARLLEIILQDPVLFYDITKVTNYGAFFSSLEPGDYLVIAGGDGTLNRFVNDTYGIILPDEVLYFPVGTGNDFAHDLGQTGCSRPFSVGQYLKALPTVEVNGTKHCFLNGVGFGIDGYCCQVGDEQRKTPGKKVNYTAIAIKGLLLHFLPRDARITVDGNTYEYKKVWIAPTMLGRFYGGGMMPTPDQDRCAPDGALTLMLFHGAGRLRTLSAFPGIFKGTHVKHTDMVALHRGHEITVEFDSPTPLQIDGETILNVTRYTARSASCKGGRRL